MSKVVDQAKDLIKRYDESEFIHRNATRLLPELVAECESALAGARGADLAIKELKNRLKAVEDECECRRNIIVSLASDIIYDSEGERTELVWEALARLEQVGALTPEFVIQYMGRPDTDDDHEATWSFHPTIWNGTLWYSKEGHECYMTESQSGAL